MIFFVNLIDMRTEWKHPLKMIKYMRDGTGNSELIFGSNTELRAEEEVYACEDAADKFIQDFIWHGIR